MVRLLLYSADPELASVLKTDFAVHPEPEPRRLQSTGEQHDVLVLDFDANGLSPKEQLALLDRLGDSAIPVIVLTDDLRPSVTAEFLLRGAFDCIRKPLSILELKVVIRRAYERRLMKTELAGVRQSACRCDQLIGSGPGAQALYDLIRRVADLTAFVLITGESGTGKELVARAIHNLSCRADQPFVAVSCGAIPESLIESELFGHEKGAFTGSTGARAGYMEQAGEGTLFLDEIGELSLNTQVKLLRVLQQREFSRLGSNRLIPLRARVVFATHRNLPLMVEEGAFRRDLFFRVNVVTVNVPPLRDRTDDLVTLARHFLERYAEEYGKPVREIRPHALQALLDYDWPGNIRELENVIQRAVILADGDSIQRVHLPEHLRHIGGEETPPAESDHGAFDELLRQFKLSLAIRAVNDCNGNKSLAAKKLGVSRAYLHRLIRLSRGRAAAAAAAQGD
jgi:DNA-binding NtrC family response regulator